MKRPVESKRVEPSLWPLAWVINSEGQPFPMKPLAEPGKPILAQEMNRAAGVDVPMATEGAAK